MRSPIGRALVCTGAALVGVFTFARCSHEAPQRKLNVVIIALDTLRPDHLGCYGSARATSPNIDAWSKDAVVFENAQTVAPWTAPSLLSLMTSLHPEVHGVMRFPDPGQMSEKVTTLAEVLARGGYKTGAFTDGGYAKPQFGLKQGFETYPISEGELFNVHDTNVSHPSRLGSNLERTLAWLETVRARPFFLFFHSYEVHGPYRPPPEFVQLFRPGYDEAAEHARLSEVLGRLNEHGEIDADGVRLILAHSEHCGAGHGPEMNVLPAKMRELGIGSLEDVRMQFWRDLYDAEIAHTDRELRRLLTFLDQPDLRENTLVVFVSDHGEGFGEHGSTGHGNILREEDLRVLLIMRAPGVAPRRVRDVVRSIDVMPTVLELVGAPLDGLAMQGRSLAPLLQGSSLTSAPAFAQALGKKDGERRRTAVRDGRWRLEWDVQAEKVQLFDLETDPQELRDVALDNPKVAERLLGLINAQRGLDATFREKAAGPVSLEYTIDPETERELRKLGYFGDDLPAPPPKKP